MIKDFLGNEIKIGDEVVFMQIDYRGLMKGIVTRIAPKSVLISHAKTNTGRTESRQFGSQCIVISSDKI